MWTWSVQGQSYFSDVAATCESRSSTKKVEKLEFPIVKNWWLKRAILVNKTLATRFHLQPRTDWISFQAKSTRRVVRIRVQWYFRESTEGSMLRPIFSTDTNKVKNISDIQLGFCSVPFLHVWYCIGQESAAGQCQGQGLGAIAQKHRRLRHAADLRVNAERDINARVYRSRCAIHCLQRWVRFFSYSSVDIKRLHGPTDCEEN